MTKSDYTAIMIISDRSGSMHSIKNEAENTLNNFIKDQAKLDGKCTVRLVEFDTEYNVVQKSRSAKRFPIYRLDPRNATALYDAIGRGIVEFGQELQDLTEDQRPGRVLVVIITDGHENASQEYTADKVKEMIGHQKSVYNWEFLFLAANQDAVLSGSKIGLTRESTLTYDFSSAGVSAMGDELTRSVTRYRQTGQASFDS